MNSVHPGPAIKGWIVHPVLDLLLVCGGAVWLLVALILWLKDGYFMYFYGGQVAFAFSAALYLFSNAHTACSWVRIGHTARHRDAFRPYWTTLAALFAGLAVAALVFPALAPHLIKLYLIWVLQHYSAQVYGLLMIYAGKNDYRFTDFHRALLKYALLLWAVSQMAYFLSPQWPAGQIFIVPVPSWGSLPAWVYPVLRIAAIAAMAAFATVTAYTYWIERKAPPLPFVLLLVTFVLLYEAGGEAGAALQMVVPAFFHGSQYVLVSAAVHVRERGLPVWSRGTVWTAGKYLGTVTALGAFLYVALPKICVYAGIPYGISAASTFAAANFHHFLSDRAIWRLRDPLMRSYIV